MNRFTTVLPFRFSRLLVPLVLLLTLSGCRSDKGNPPSVQAHAENSHKVAPVLTPHSSAFTAHSSASSAVTEKKSGAASEEHADEKSPGEKKPVYLPGEDPEIAKKKGWPVKSPTPLPGAILPRKRIVAYYGNPLSKKMGALGQYEKKDMIRRLMEESNRWQSADPSKPVLPALHLIAVVAQGTPGKAGKYRMIMPDDIVNQVYQWAREANCIFFIDIQTGHEDIRTLLPRFEWILKNPDVHLGIDPEFNLVASMKIPGTKIGTFDAEQINYVTGYLRGLVKKYNLPPKVLTVHRFTRNGVTNSTRIELRPEVQIVMNMDGWGGPHLKRRSYQDYIVDEPVQYTGFKLFYYNDTKKGDPLMTPKDVLRLKPTPVYIMYQ